MYYSRFTRMWLGNSLAHHSLVFTGSNSPNLFALADGCEGARFELIGCFISSLKENRNQSAKIVNSLRSHRAALRVCLLIYLTTVCESIWSIHQTKNKCYIFIFFGQNFSIALIFSGSWLDKSRDSYANDYLQWLKKLLSISKFKKLFSFLDKRSLWCDWKLWWSLYWCFGSKNFIGLCWNFTFWHREDLEIIHHKWVPDLVSHINLE